MKNSLSLIMVALLTFSSVGFASISEVDLLNYIETLNHPKMCVLEAYYSGVTYLTCDGTKVEGALGEDYHYKNLTKVGALLVKKELSPKSCQIVRGQACSSCSDSNIGDICYFSN